MLFSCKYLLATTEAISYITQLLVYDGSKCKTKLGMERCGLIDSIYDHEGLHVEMEKDLRLDQGRGYHWTALSCEECL